MKDIKLQTYLVKGQTTYLNVSTGHFNSVINGEFVATNNNTEDVKVFIPECPTCETKSYWIRYDDLNDADGCMECDLCGTFIYPDGSYEEIVIKFYDDDCQ